MLSVAAAVMAAATATAFQQPWPGRARAIPRPEPPRVCSVPLTELDPKTLPQTMPMPEWKPAAGVHFFIEKRKPPAPRCAAGYRYAWDR